MISTAAAPLGPAAQTNVLRHMDHEKLLRRVERTAQMAIYEVDIVNGTWTGSNYFLEMFGWTEQRTYTIAEFAALVHPEDHSAVMQRYAACLEEQRAEHHDQYRCLLPDGRIMHVASHLAFTYGPDGTPLRALGLKQDVTAQKQAERKLAALNRRLSAINRRKDEILGVVAHDLRSPIARIEGLTNLLKFNLSEEQLTLVRMQEEAIALTKNIISELLEVALLNEDEALNTASVNLDALVRRGIGYFQYRLDDKKISIRTDLKANQAVELDTDRFLRVIDNLLSNAVKFSEPGQHVEIATAVVGEWAVLRVRDHGVGIQPEHLPLLFEKGQKATRRPGTQGEPSTGLGLSIVKDIVDKHGGTIGVESTPGVGTLFTVRLPLTRQ